jgi:hypothetical protein
MGDFHGLPTGILENEFIRLEYLTTSGPRIVRFSPRGHPNVLAELPDIQIPTSLGPYNIRGGHRLWCAPESPISSYAPDDAGLKVEELEAGVRLTGPAEPATGIVKVMEIRLSPGRPAVTVQHQLHNNGRQSLTLAPWAITMLPLGGTAILPQPVWNPDAQGLLPNRILALWPYSHIQDTRLTLRDDFILIRPISNPAHFKIGYYDPVGWLAYWNAGSLFRKTFEIVPPGAYPDGGCNAEVYCDNNVIELESLGGLTPIKPGQSAHFKETWELYESLEQSFLPEGNWLGDTSRN